MEGEVRKAATSPPPTPQFTVTKSLSFHSVFQHNSPPLPFSPLRSPPNFTVLEQVTNYGQIWSCFSSPPLPSLPSAYPLLNHTLRASLENQCAFKLKKKMISSTVRKVTIPSTSVCYIFPYGPAQVHIR